MDLVTWNIEDGVAFLGLNRPNRANAINKALAQRLLERLSEAHKRSDVRAIVLHGNNGKFSSGVDVVEVFASAAKTPEGLRRYEGDVNRVNQALLTHFEAGPKPTVVAIEKMALAGALELALACNASVATSDAKLGLLELRIGILPGWGGLQRLIRMTDVSRALHMMLYAEIISGQHAFRLGLVDKVVWPSQEELLGVAKNVALELADGNRSRRQVLSSNNDRPEWEVHALEALPSAEDIDHPWYVGKTVAELCIAAARESIVGGPDAGQTFITTCNCRLSKMMAHKSAVKTFEVRYRARHASPPLRWVLTLWAHIVSVWAMLVMFVVSESWKRPWKMVPTVRKTRDDHNKAS